MLDLFGVRVVGLTGGIGSGKSSVARMLAELGATVIDADVLAREVVAKGTPGLQQVVARFPGVLSEDGQLDREKLGRIIFGDAAARKDLNAIVHPLVSALSMERMQAAHEAGAPLIIYDVPLLYEVGLDAVLKEVIVVFVDPDVQKARVKARDGLSDAEVEARISAQAPLQEKVRKADHTIDNNGDLDATRARVEALYQTLVASKAQGD